MSDKLVLNENGLSGYNNYSYGGASLQALGFSIGALGNFITSVMSQSVMEQLGNGFTNKAEFICSIKCFPYCVTDNIIPKQSSFYAYIGNSLQTIEINRPFGIIKEKIYISKTFDFATNISNFTQIEPYTTCEIYLPYVGYINLDMSELRASNGNLKVDLLIDTKSGNGIYSISRQDINKNWYIFYTTQTNFSMEIPIGANNTARQNQYSFMASFNGVAGIGKTLVGGLSGNSYMTSRGMGDIVSGITDYINSKQQSLIQRGTLGNYPTSFNSPTSIYFILKKQKINDYDSFKSVYGKPLNQSVKLSSLKGMTFIPNPKIEIPNITSNEYDELIGLMQNGIIIDETFNVDNVKLKGTYKLQDKIQLTKVKLKGTYEDYKVKVSNILLKGRYNLMDKMSVSNVKLIGTYKASRVRVKNVKLKGRYNLQDKLSVSNVNLIGTYKASRVRVSNVLLKGLYKIQDKLSVSNVSLKGTYEEYKINVSNVALSGNYTLQPKISVSNVGLSGTYTEEVYYFITSDNLILTTSDNKYFIPKEDS